MKKSILFTLVMMLISLCATAQPRMMRPFIDYSQYENVDSLPIEMVSVHLNHEIEDEKILENVIELGSGDYMFKIPKPEKMVIKTNFNRKKAIVTYKSFAVGGRFELPIGGRYEYNIEENERRIVLWYKDDRTYCGYVYDKRYKICQCFEEKKAYKRFMRRFELK